MNLTDFSRLCIEPEADLVNVLKCIDKAALGFALVVSDSGVLLGTITDGDIRRSLMEGNSSNKAHELMNSAPTILRSGEDIDFDGYLSINRLSFVPILDHDDRLVSVAIKEQLPGIALDDVCIAIMAGGLGKRLGELTKHTPKPLLEINGEPILQKIVRGFSNEGFKKFVFCVNYKSHMIEEYFGDGSQFGIEIEYVRESKQLGTGGAMSLVNRKDYRRFFVTNADILSSSSYRDMLDFHKREGSMATMAVREHTVDIPFGVVEVNGLEIVGLKEKPSFTYFINAGFYLIEAEVLDYIPKEKFFDMPTLFSLLENLKNPTRIFPTKGDWIDIGRPEDLERAKMVSKQGG